MPGAKIVDEILAGHLPSGNQKRFWRDTTIDQMAARRKSDQRRDDLCVGGLRKRVAG
jgi:hypothetical protein